MGSASAYFSGLACSLDGIGDVVRNERNMYKLQEQTTGQSNGAEKDGRCIRLQGTRDGPFKLITTSGHQEQRQRNEERSERTGNVGLGAESPRLTVWPANMVHGG